MIIENISKTEDYLSVNFSQAYYNIPVINSDGGLTINIDGELVSFGADFYNDINITVSPVMNEIGAINTIIGGNRNYVKSDNSRLVIYPKIDDQNIQYLLSWELHILNTDNNIQYIYYVNSSDGGVIDKIALVRNGGYFGGTLKYKYFPNHHYDTPSETYCSNMDILIYNAIGQKCADLSTNSSGYYATVDYLASANYFVYAVLRNDYVEVRDRNVLLTDYVINFNNTSPTNLATIASPSIPRAIYNKTWDACDATNLYYHVNFVHDHFKSSFNFNSMDYSMIATFDAGSLTNGSADGTNIEFGYLDGKFWARASDVIYHEYTHNVIYHIYDGFIESGSSTTSQAIAMDEGLADFFACSLTNDAIMGESVDVNRSLSNNYSWNPINDRYYNGQVIGGACWDLRTLVGQNTAEQLVFQALQLSPKARNFAELLENLLFADALLYSGNNRTSILTAFDNHNIEPEILTATMEGPTSLTSYQTGTWNVSVEGGVPPYTYSWLLYVPCDGGGVPAVAPCGDWYDLAATSSSLSRYDTQNFEIKCIIRDALNQVSACSKFVYVSSAQALIKENDDNYAQETEEELPNNVLLKQNYPNPFNPNTTINFQINEPSNVKISIYNSLGQLVTILTNGFYESGKYSVVFNGSNLASGIYYYRIITDLKVETKQMILLK